MTGSTHRGTRRTLGASALALAALGWFVGRIERRWLHITRLTLPIPNLPPAFEGYRLVHLADIHLGVGWLHRQLPAILDAVNREQPDLIALTGDIGTGGRDGLAAGQPELARLRATDGTWAVLGNHDFYVGVDRVAAVLAGAGITLLRNQHAVIQRGGDRLVIAGLDDALFGLPDLPAALDGVPADAVAVLMAHEPDIASMIAADARVVLQLSGHTHGGQFRLPGFRPLVLPTLGHRYAAGVYWIDDMALYVTTGVGTGRIPLRINCHPEIAVITLIRSRLSDQGRGTAGDEDH
jgi:predicted MPP superfamily phosphohydrolase